MRRRKYLDLRSTMLRRGLGVNLNHNWSFVFRAPTVVYWEACVVHEDLLAASYCDISTGSVVT